MHCLRKNDFLWGSICFLQENARIVVPGLAEAILGETHDWDHYRQEFGSLETNGLLTLSTGVDRKVCLQSKFVLFGSWEKFYKLKFCRLVKSASKGENVVPRNGQTVWDSKFRNNMENSSYRRGDCGCFPDRRLEGYVYKKGIQNFSERHADITRLQQKSQT